MNGNNRIRRESSNKRQVSKHTSEHEGPAAVQGNPDVLPGEAIRQVSCTRKYSQIIAKNKATNHGVTFQWSSPDVYASLVTA